MLPHAAASPRALWWHGCMIACARPCGGAGRQRQRSQGAVGAMQLRRLAAGVGRYCLRLLDQSSIKLAPERASLLTAHDRALIQAVPTEVVRIFDILCTLDSSLIVRLFPDLKRLFSRGAQAAGGTGPSLTLALLRFFTKHGETIAYDIEPLLASFFSKVGRYPYPCLFSLFRCLLLLLRVQRNGPHAAAAVATTVAPRTVPRAGPAGQACGRGTALF